MGFYDNSSSDTPNKKVVSIGNQSAVIRNLVVEESAEFKCNAEFAGEIGMHKLKSDGTIDPIGFVWKIESNGSLSLATTS